MNTFNIIYVYVKEHNKTGLKYFGKTIKNPFTYHGSGKLWTRHLNKHGIDITTTEVWGFDSHDLAKEFAISFSTINNIVKSSVWANLKIEEMDGGDTSHCESYKIGLKKRRSYQGCKNPMFGRSIADEKSLRWYNDGTDNIYVPVNTQPVSFKEGRIINYKLPHTAKSKEKMAISKIEKGKRVISPEGEIFMNRQEASNYLKCRVHALTEKIRRGKSGWKFL